MAPNETRQALLIAALVVSVGAIVAAAAESINPYVFQLYGDANSRLVGSRMMVDSVSPGIHWIGTVWLPLPGLMFLPFSLIDSLYYSGRAGLVVCLPLLAWTSARLYCWMVSLTGRRWLATTLALAYAFNPNMLYISLTSMSEPIVLFFFVGASWHWVRWVERRADPSADSELWLGSLNAAGATLCRYEAWPFVGVAVLGLAAYVWGLRGSSRRTVCLLLATATAFTGIILWILWNWSQFGDPLHFHHAEYYSASWQALNRKVRDTFYLQLGSSLGIYWTTIVAVFGYGFLAAAMAGAVLLTRRKPVASSRFTLGLLLVMPSFTVLSLYLGVAEMTRWWNSRYVLLLAPFVYLAAAVASSRAASIMRRPQIAAPIMAVVFVITTAWQAGGRVVTLADAAGGFHYGWTPSATEVGEMLHRDWRGGQVLIAAGSGQAHRIIQPSWVQVRHFVIALNHDRQYLDPDSLTKFTWVIISLDPSSDGEEFASSLLSRAEELKPNFERLETNGPYLVFRRRLDSAQP